MWYVVVLTVTPAKRLLLKNRSHTLLFFFCSILFFSACCLCSLSGLVHWPLCFFLWFYHLPLFWFFLFLWSPRLKRISSAAFLTMCSYLKQFKYLICGNVPWLLSVLIPAKHQLMLNCYHFLFFVRWLQRHFLPAVSYVQMLFLQHYW